MSDAPGPAAAAATRADALAGLLQVRPGGTPSLAVARPVIGAAVMARLVEGRPASAVPALLQAVFTLCGTAHGDTAARAVAMASGAAAAIDGDSRGPASSADGNAMTRDRACRALQHATAREHLQRLAFDLPERVPVPGVPPDPGWLRACPLFQSPGATDAARLVEWLRDDLFGRAPADWLDGWDADPTRALADWSAASAHPVARWLQAVRDPAERIGWSGAPLSLLDDPATTLPVLARRLDLEADFAMRPDWQGRAAETGPWTRHRLTVDARAPATAWLRLGSRLADLARLALVPDWLQAGALRTGPDEAIAWTEMSRGLLMHWVRLAPTPDPSPAQRTVARYRVLAPTEWNFHAAGALAGWLATRPVPAVPGDDPESRLAVTALDPCVRFCFA